MPSSQYLAEKATGERLANGALRLKRLKAKHLRIIQEHLAGTSSTDIAQAVGMTDATISRILNDPLAQAVIEQTRQVRAQEFLALEGMHIDALRAGLTSGDVRDRIRAAAVYGRERVEREKASGGGAETAEDVIQRILQLNIQVNVSGNDAA